MMQKTKAIESNLLRGAAKGEQCTMNIAGVCNYDQSTVVLAHFPSDIAGTKSTDLSAGFLDAACHDVIDRRNANIELSNEDREFYMRRSQVRTLHRLIEKEIVVVKGA